MIKIDKLIDSITSYLKIRFDILKIDLIEKISSSISSVISGFILFFILLFVLAFASLTAGSILNFYFESEFLGYAIITGIYIVIFLGILVFFGRNVARIQKEYKTYNYNIIKNAYYKDFQQNFDITKRIEKIIMCTDNPTDYKCENENIKSKRIFNSYMFYRK